MAVVARASAGATAAVGACLAYDDLRRLASRATTCVTAAQFGTVAYGVVALWSLAAAFSTDDEAWDAAADDGATRLQVFRTAGVAAALSAARGLLWETDPSDALDAPTLRERAAALDDRFAAGFSFRDLLEQRKVDG